MERERKRDREVDRRRDDGHRRDKGVKREKGVYCNNACDQERCDGNKNCKLSEKSHDKEPLLSSSLLREGTVKVKQEGVLSWVCASRKIVENSSSEKEKAMHLCKVFEEQDSSVLGDSSTSEEKLNFRKPKKVKSLRKKEKLDLDVLEFEVSSGGIGVGVHESRKYGQTADKNEQERRAAQLRSEAYHMAFAKAEGAAKVLRQELLAMTQVEHDGNLVFGDEEGGFNKSLELSRRLAWEKQDDRAVSGPLAVASLALSISPLAECPESAKTCKRKVVFTEMEEFAHGIQLREEIHRPKGESTRDEEKVCEPANEETKDKSGGFSEVSDFSEAAHSVNKEAIPWNADSEVVVGKGLSGTLELLRKHGDLKDTKKLEMNQKELYRELCHKFHGKEPGKLKKEKRMKQQEQEQAMNSYSPSLSVDRMRAAQTQMKRPFVLLSGRLNPGQISDPRSGLATV